MKHTWKATHDDVLEAANWTSVFEISPNTMGIRKKAQSINNKFKLLGLD
jgi:hypothetical protein